MTSLGLLPDPTPALIVGAVIALLVSTYLVLEPVFRRQVVIVRGELMVQCALCPNHLNPDDDDVYQEVVAWRLATALMPKAVLEENTGQYAHGDCMRGRIDGQVEGQGTLFDA